MKNESQREFAIILLGTIFAPLLIYLFPMGLFIALCAAGTVLRKGLENEAFHVKIKYNDYDRALIYAAVVWLIVWNTGPGYRFMSRFIHIVANDVCAMSFAAPKHEDSVSKEPCDDYWGE